MAADRWGVTDGYWDTGGAWHPTSPATAAALHAAMGVAHDAETPGSERPLWFVRQGDAARLLGPCELTLGDGTELGVVLQLPADLPLGDHRLAPCDGGPVTHLVVAPTRCHLPPGLRAWGWTAQLYAARSEASWGHGDLGDLATLTSAAAAQGAGFVGINPLHAVRTKPTVQPSPYYPSSRLWQNPLYLRVEHVEGFEQATGALAHDLHELATLGRALNADRLLDQGRVWTLKRKALEALWAAFASSRRRAELEAWRQEQGASLHTFTTYCALAEQHGDAWQHWPAQHRDPAGPEVAAFAKAHADRVGFHAWLQWLLAEQLAAATATVPVLGDLAVGFDPGGADAWRWQHLLALDARIGAPPDEFNAEGQDWGTPPFVPAKLRAAHYEPWREVLAALCRPGGGLRIDHVMGLFRLFWVPPDGAPGDGAYVRSAGNELLDLVALASATTGTVIVGEDLGTVQDEVRGALADRGVLSTRLVWFEDGPPRQYPSQALATLSTHDLPTLAGLLSGEDAADRARAGLRVDPADDVSLRAHLATALGRGEGPAVDHGAPEEPPATTAAAVAEALSASPAMLVAMTLDDALGVEQRPNLPGTTDAQHPNWRLALPVPLDVALDEPGLAATAAAMARHRTRSSGEQSGR